MSAPRASPLSIVHVDLDQFYAAVEMLDFPELRGKPLIVGGRAASRGVVCTASYEARAFGVHSAMPSSQAARLCPQAVWRAPRMERYAEKSREIRAVFERYTDRIQPLSLDEAFLDLAGSLQLFGSAEKIGRRIKDDILRETGLTASVGVAENKFLAKIASDLKKPDGFVVIQAGESNACAVLHPLQVSRLWGAGPKTCEKLHALGLRTIGELARADSKWLARKIGGDLAQHLLQLAHGSDARAVECGGLPKSIGRENTFAKDLFDCGVMERELLAFADEVAARLRSEQLKARGVTLKVKFTDFTRVTRALLFDEPTDVSEPFYQAAQSMLRERVEFNGKGIRLLGISATHLQRAGAAEQSLFPDPQAGRRQRAAQAIDKLRSRFGDSAVTYGRLLEGREENTGTPRI